MSNLIPLSLAQGMLKRYAAFVEKRRKPMGTLAADLHHMTTGVSGEGGEALDITKKIWVYGQELHTVNKKGVTHRNHLIEEAGDALFYLQGLCNLLGISLLDLIESNQAKLLIRYPTGYSDAAAAFRADKQDPNAACEEK